MAVSCMRNASGHKYRNSSFTVDLAMGQIPCSTERTCISSCYIMLLADKQTDRQTDKRRVKHNLCGGK